MNDSPHPFHCVTRSPHSFHWVTLSVLKFFVVVAVNGSESDATDDEESKEESEEESDADDEDLPHLGKQLIHHIYFISQI